MVDHYQSHMRFPICNEQIRTIPPTFNVEVVGLKSCNLSDILHILKELEYTLPIIPHLERYYFFYRLHTCFSIRFLPPRFNAKIIIEDFEHMWKIQDKEFCEYLAYNILCSYIVFNDNCGHGVLKHLIGYLDAYTLR
jgi:hypothetical protein